MNLRRSGATLAILVLIAACGGGSLATGSAAPTAPSASAVSPTASLPASPEPTPPPTAWEAALNKIGPDGSFDLQSALDLFATAFGPLPGSNAQQDLTGIDDRTVAISAVMAHASELSAEQKAAIDRHITPPADATRILIPPVAKGRLEVYPAVVDESQQAAIRDLVGAQRSYIADHIAGGDFEGDIEFFYKTNAPGSPNTLASAWSDWPGGNFGKCQITVYDNTFAGKTGGDKLVDAVVAHELFHCFQFNGYGTLAAEAAAKPWIVEGQAGWVGEEVGGPSGVVGHWSKYLTIPYLSLFTRVYDTIGFYSHLAERGIDPWGVFPAMWEAGSNNIEAYAATGADDQDFLDTWASSVMRQPGRGGAWDTTGPDIPSSEVAYHPNFFDVSDGSKVDLSTPFYTNDVRYLTVGTDMLFVDIDGHGRLSDGSVDTTSLAGVWFCIDGHTCKKKCENAPDPPPYVDTLSNFIAIASTGGPDGTVGTATGKDLEKDCETPTPSATPDEFCTRYLDYVAWAKSNGSGDITKPLAAEIANRFTDMQPYAPAELASHVALMIKVYGTYAAAPPGIDLPLVGPDAAHIYEALTAFNNYCHVTFP